MPAVRFSTCGVLDFGVVWILDLGDFRLGKPHPCYQKKVIIKMKFPSKGAHQEQRETSHSDKSEAPTPEGDSRVLFAHDDRASNHTRSNWTDVKAETGHSTATPPQLVIKQ